MTRERTVREEIYVNNEFHLGHVEREISAKHPSGGLWKGVAKRHQAGSTAELKPRVEKDQVKDRREKNIGI